MKIFSNYLQLTFKLSNICLIILYLYPGSVIGFILYNDFGKQPQITRDLFDISSNHIYAFCLISFIGLLAIVSKKNLFIYLFFPIALIELLNRELFNLLSKLNVSYTKSIPLENR